MRLMMVLIPLCAVAFLMLHVPRTANASAEAWSGKAPPPIDLEPHPHTATAYFGMGCFWGSDSQFGSMPGIVRTAVGYCGGKKQNATYHDIGDNTETVQVVYDTDRLSYADLLQTFSHAVGCGGGHGGSHQYDRVVFYSNDAEHQAATRLGLNARPATHFWRAEDYHQKYYLQQNPKLMAEFQAHYATFDAFVDSTAAARANGWFSGRPVLDRHELTQIGLTPAAMQELTR